MSALEKILAQRRARLERSATMQAYSRWMGLALEIPLGVAFGLVAGAALDRHWGTRPWGVWIGLVFGFVVAGRAMFRLVRAYRRENADA